MRAMDDMALLREYAARNSETAFEELVSRRIGFVYSAALRQVCNPTVAEDVTQAVFILLAQKANRISDKTILTGWLFKTTRFAAIAQTRAATKRRQREQEAQMQSDLQSDTPDPLWEQISPMLMHYRAASPQFPTSATRRITFRLTHGGGVSGRPASHTSPAGA